MSRCLICPERIDPHLNLCLDCFEREHRARSRQPRYPFAVMQVSETITLNMPRSSVAPAAHNYGKRHGRQFSTHACGPAGCVLTRTT